LLKVLVAAALVTVFVVPAASGLTATRSRSVGVAAPAPAGRVWRDGKARLAVHYPAGWHLTTRSLTTITQPVQRFVIYSAATPRPVTVAGPRPDQVLAVVMEQIPVSAADLRRFPGRPGRFTVRHLGGVEGFGDRWAELVFRDNGRAFYAFIGVGTNAGRQLPALLRALDTLRVAA
jgi:hypothetical protein